MVENPSSWNIVTRTINEAYLEHREQWDKGVCGYSLPRFIELKLRDKGLIRTPEITHEPDPMEPTCAYSYDGTPEGRRCRYCGREDVGLIRTCPARQKKES